MTLLAKRALAGGHVALTPLQNAVAINTLCGELSALVESLAMMKATQV